MTHIENWTLAALAAFLLSGACILDGDPEMWTADEAVKQAKLEERRERAAAELCFKTAGYGSRPQWRIDGVLECVPKRGRVVVAGGA